MFSEILFQLKFLLIKHFLRPNIFFDLKIFWPKIYIETFFFISIIFFRNLDSIFIKYINHRMNSVRYDTIESNLVSFVIFKANHFLTKFFTVIPNLAQLSSMFDTTQPQLVCIIILVSFSFCITMKNMYFPLQIDERCLLRLMKYSCRPIL